MIDSQSIKADAMVGAGIRGFVVLHKQVDHHAALHPPDAHPPPGARLRTPHRQRRGDDLLVDDLGRSLFPTHLLYRYITQGRCALRSLWQSTPLLCGLHFA
ncbi:hypothetical protein ACFWNT_42675 [Streptomyces sp. NPDC058409]|uniref:hypothetical protein n=1 Tax=Streptomyces sp. NPDC058409 TaxID=3346484 RepID=UPI003652F47C